MVSPILCIVCLTLSRKSGGWVIWCSDQFNPTLMPVRISLAASTTRSGVRWFRVPNSSERPQTSHAECLGCSGSRGRLRNLGKGIGNGIWCQSDSIPALDFLTGESLFMLKIPLGYVWSDWPDLLPGANVDLTCSIEVQWGLHWRGPRVTREVPSSVRISILPWAKS